MDLHENSLEIDLIIVSDRIEGSEIQPLQSLNMDHDNRNTNQLSPQLPSKVL